MCGVIVLIGVIYLRNAPSPESDASMDTIGSSHPADPAAPQAQSVVRSVTADLTISLKALADEATTQAEPEVAPVTAPPTTKPKPVTTVTSTVPPTTIAPVVVSTTTTLAPILGIIPVPVLPAVVAAPLAALTNGESGVASWYGAPTGTCAHKSLPFGTMIRVTRVSTGAAVTCRVADRGPFGPGRVIDLSEDTFQQIASLGTGLTEVRLDW